MPAEPDEWLRFAEADLAAALLLIDDRELPPRIACFHAQQAAEKALKAAIVASGTPIPRVHDLLALVGLASDRVTSGLASLDLSALHPWAVDARYPGDLPDVSHEEGRLLIDVAAQSVAIIRAC